MSAKSKLKNIQFIVEGEVTKSPPYDRMKKLSSWHKRYMALLKLSDQNVVPIGSKKGPSKKHSISLANSQYCLTYWDTKVDREKGEKPIRTIALLKDDLVRIQEAPYFTDDFKFIFALVTVERNFYFNASDEAKRKEWVDNIHEAIQSTDVNQDSKDHLYESIFEILRLKREQEKGRRLSQTSNTSSFDRRYSTDSKSSNSSSNSTESPTEKTNDFEEEGENNETEKYTVMHAARKSRAVSLTYHQKPSNYGRKISVPANFRRPVSELLFSPDIPGTTVDERPVKPPRKSSAPYPIYQQNEEIQAIRNRRKSEDNYNLVGGGVSRNTGSHGSRKGFDENNNEPVYWEVEKERVNEDFDRSGSFGSSEEKQTITYYDVCINVPKSAKISMSEHMLSINTGKVSCTIKYDAKSKTVVQV